MQIGRLDYNAYLKLLKDARIKANPNFVIPDKDWNKAYKPANEAEIVAAYQLLANR